MNGLYLPYIKWSLLFLILHNSFRYLHITESVIYQTDDYVRQFIKMIAMTDYELLIRPFWFIKELLFTSIIVATISLFCNRFCTKNIPEVLFTFSLIASILAKFIPVIPVIGNTSLLFLCIAYFYSGILLNKYRYYISMTYTTILLTFIIVTVGSLSFNGTIDMRFTNLHNLIPYYLLSIMGIIMILSISKKLEQTKHVSILFYIGNHTMPILALNLLALKIGSLIKIWMYNLSIEDLASYTVIYDNNTYFWLIYTIVGVSCPLLVEYLFYRFVLRN